MTVTSSIDLPASTATEYNLLSPNKTSFTAHQADSNLNDSSQMESRSIVEKMHIFSQMQAQPFLEESLLEALERLEAGMAFTYVMRRISEVTKLSEVDAIWAFLFNYEASRNTSLHVDQILKLRKLLSSRVVNELMSEDKSPSDQRYLKLAAISRTFDHSMRAFDTVFFSSKENDGNKSALDLVDI